MKIPKTLKIGAHQVAIVKHESINDDEYGDCCGLARMDSLVIELAGKVSYGDLPETKQAETFLHEIIHFVSHNAGLDLKERQILGLAHGLFQVIRENKLDFINVKEA
jgi:hypothetical protein